MPDDKLPYKPLPAGSGGGAGCCRTFTVEFFIWFAWLCLELTNIILHILWGISGLFKACLGMLSPSKEEKSVVIVGASFGGLACQRELSGVKGLKVTLVDWEYFSTRPASCAASSSPRGSRSSPSRCPRRQ